MADINANFNNLQTSYLFTDIARRIADYLKENPGANLIRMGIGDVTLPLCPAVIEALHKAVEEMAKKETFRGYGPEQGYDFLREVVLSYYKSRGVELKPADIFIGDGAKSDVANFMDLFSGDNVVVVPDPVYPVYVDVNVMAGRKILYLNANESNGFLPLPDADTQGDVFYLCAPNNPTGAAYNRTQLKQWVDFTRERKGLILYDAAYEFFIDDPAIPHSIFEIPGARECAVEFCSFSKTAGFTGVRVGYTVVPEELAFGGASVNKMWLRRQTTKFNGVSYIAQRGAAAVFTPEGLEQVKGLVGYYKENSKIIAAACDKEGWVYFGGHCSPYVWIKCPDQMDSWAFFDLLLKKAGVVCTPGSGFGKNGKTFFRLSAFNTKENTTEAMNRMRSLLK